MSLTVILWWVLTGRTDQQVSTDCFDSLSCSCIHIVQFMAHTVCLCSVYFMQFWEEDKFTKYIS